MTIVASRGIISSSFEFGPPLRYDDFVNSYIVTMAEAVAANMGTGPDDVEDPTYGENAARTVFYSCYDNLWRARVWGQRTGNHVGIDQAGLEKALEVQIKRWGDGANGARSPAYHRAPEVPYYALQRAETYDGGTPTVEDDLFRHVSGDNVTPTQEFTFSRINEYDNSNNDARLITVTRPVAYVAKACIYWEMHSDVRYLDFPSSAVAIEFWYEAMINHLHRWRHEFNSTESEAPLFVDDGAHFMMSLTIKALSLCRERFLALEEDPEQYFPATVMDGEWYIEAEKPGDIANPHTDTIDMLTEFVDWEYAAIDGFTPFTDTYPADSPYFRVTHDNTPGGSSPGPPVAVVAGDPMLVNFGTHVYIKQRTTDSGFTANIQMMQVENLWWMAKMMDERGDTLRRNKYIRWGDLIFAGAVNFGVPSAQKARNQQMYAVFEALEYRNQVTGRND